MKTHHREIDIAYCDVCGRPWQKCQCERIRQQLERMKAAGIKPAGVFADYARRLAAKRK